MNKFFLLAFMMLVPQVAFAGKITIINNTDSDIEVPNNSQCQCRANCGHEILDCVQADEEKIVSMTEKQEQELRGYMQKKYPHIALLTNGIEKKIYLVDNLTFGGQKGIDNLF